MLAITRSLPLRIPTRLFSTTPISLSGHSKWSTIKHDKAKNDAEKNKIANKFSNAIAVATKLGGSDPSHNVRLATAIENAQKNNVLKKVIEQAIKRGAGIGSEKKNVDTALYEGVGPGGVSFVVESLTDNKTRTIGLVRSAFTKAGGSLSPTLYQFDRRGLIVIEKGELTFDDIFEKVIEVGAEDLEEIEGEDFIEIITDPSDTGKIADELKKEFTIKEVGISYIPKEDMLVDISDEDTKIKYDKFIAALEEISDVTDYYSNLKNEE
ncbi:hypothetical protein BN7_5297 [Wickerhamomyces ciferrii]|uniref:Transcriptional regulatory protein n=1 Tax=Wickerhamomyces ciferrii (strain ATCC 14091 / BCRC 22168 / CBS 111 / JCM 3599 / NBRC 0793 / NRRL Y-1031 F-60-10) TaxID=1206466 RepID=K0KUX7_WICCF|nr:uncharacterized protein BN7_5297 [Wickerhamomyces ciferrii]CCH45712.1 hypothetical protein BN7_5297 [Wickerhamomyces ciferrii]